MNIYAITSWDHSYIRATNFDISQDWTRLKQYAKAIKNSKIQLLQDMKADVEGCIYDICIWKEKVDELEAKKIISELTNLSNPPTHLFIDLSAEILKEQEAIRNNYQVLQSIQI